MSDSKPNGKHDQRTSKQSGSFQRAPDFRDAALQFKQRALSAKDRAEELKLPAQARGAEKLAQLANELAFAFERWMTRDVEYEARMASINSLAQLQDDLGALETLLAR